MARLWWARLWRRGARLWIVATVAALFLTTSTSPNGNGGGGSGGGTEPAVAKVEIAPTTATVQEGDQIQLRATLFDGNGDAIPTGYEDRLEWRPGAWLTIVARGPRSVTLQAASDFGPTVTESVTAAVEATQSDPAKVTIEAAAQKLTPGDFDEITNAVSATPMVGYALVDGRPDQTDAGCTNDLLLKVEGTKQFENLVGPCSPDHRGEVAYFSEDYKADFRGFGWTGSTDQVDEAGLSGHLVVPLALWIASTKEMLGTEPILDVLESDFGDANGLFRTNRVGVQFDSLGGGFQTIPTSQISAVGKGCSTADAWTTDGSGTPPANFTLKALNIYFVEETEDGGTAWHCRPTPQRPENVIYVSLGWYRPTTLPHELGHALGLLLPGSGHTGSGSPDIGNDVDGFDETNLMWTGNNATVAGRSGFSLGQAFRMNAHPDSWLNRAIDLSTGTQIRSGDTRVCQCDPYSVAAPADGWPLYEDPGLGQACPGLPIGASAGSWETSVWSSENLCGDEIRVPVDGLDDPARLVVHGKFVGTNREPQFGSRLGHSYEYTGSGDQTLRVLVPNMHPPGTVEPVWVAVFYHSWAPLYETITGAVLDQMTAYLKNRIDIDEWCPGICPLQNRVKVKLHVWFVGGDPDGSLETLAKKDLAELRTRYEESFAGLQVDWDIHNGGGDNANGASVADLQPSQTGEINVYYVPAGHSLEPALTADQGATAVAAMGSTVRIAIPAADPPYSSTGLSHHFGHALGLSDVSADPFAETNLMWDQQPTGLRAALTLGQVFRAFMSDESWLRKNLAIDLSWLGSSLDCAGADANSCPPLDIGQP